MRPGWGFVSAVGILDRQRAIEAVKFRLLAHYESRYHEFGSAIGVIGEPALPIVWGVPFAPSLRVRRFDEL